MIKLQPLNKTNIVFRKMYSNQEMLDYKNGNAQQKNLVLKRCARWSLNFLRGNLGWPTQNPVLVYAPLRRGVQAYNFGNFNFEIRVEGEG